MSASAIKQWRKSAASIEEHGMNRMTGFGYNFAAALAFLTLPPSKTPTHCEYVLISLSVRAQYRCVLFITQFSKLTPFLSDDV